MNWTVEYVRHYGWSYEKVWVSLGIKPVTLHGVVFWIEKLVARHFPREKVGTDHLLFWISRTNNNLIRSPPGSHCGRHPCRPCRPCYPCRPCRPCRLCRPCHPCCPRPHARALDGLTSCLVLILILLVIIVLKLIVVWLFSCLRVLMA